MPRVSVIMAAYNVAPYIAASIEGILGQSFTDFELLIINDASSDDTRGIIAQYKDARLVTLDSAHNTGAASARNSALQIAQGEYIAIADADDISLPHRLEKQVAYLESHPEIGIVGAQYRIMNADGRLTSQSTQLPPRHNQIIWGLFTGHTIAHPCTMMRATALDAAGRHYQAELSAGEDYELWLRLLFVTRFANLPEALVQYRHWPGSLSQSQTDIQARNTADVFSQVVGTLIGKTVPNDLFWHTNTAYLKDHLLTEEQAHTATVLLLELYDALRDANLFDVETLAAARSGLAQQIRLISRRSRGLLRGLLLNVARVYTPHRVRRLWGRVKLFILARMP